jgi:hypothetical protein
MATPSLHGTLRGSKARAPAAGKQATAAPARAPASVSKDADAAPLAPRQEFYEQTVQYSAKGASALTDAEKAVMKHIDVSRSVHGLPDACRSCSEAVAANQHYPLTNTCPPFMCIHCFSGKPAGKLRHP